MFLFTCSFYVFERSANVFLFSDIDEHDRLSREQEGKQ